ncbi:MAG: hypothetical protein ABSE95_18835 [Thermodesulfobacteriota bacterium]
MGTQKNEELNLFLSILNLLDVNSDGKLSAKEMITAADKLIDGLVPILDTNGDGTLSRDELAVFELLFTGQKATGAYQPAGSGTENSSDLQKIFSLKV